MKQVKYWILLLLGFQGLLAGCKKSFLEVPPKANPVRNQYVSSLSTCEEYLNGIYADISANVITKYFPTYPDLVADNIKPAASSMFSMYSWNQASSEDMNFSPTSLNMNALWVSGYRVIRSCNYLLENIDRYSGENATKTANIKGQALSLRAFLYHLLVNVFAQPYSFSANGEHPGVPYVLSSDYTAPINGRQTVAEVYKGIIDDLSQALTLLPNSQSNKFTIGKTAARALLARVCLYKNDFALAKNMAREVINLVPLLPSALYPDNLFKLQDAEALFQLPPSVIATGNYVTNFPSLAFKRSIELYATTDIATILNERPGDSRRKWLSLTGTNWKVVKFPSNQVAGITDSITSYYYTVARTSEMYLTAAEGYAQTGNADSARFFLDAVRKRADPTAAASIADGAALIDSVLKERRKELCFEGFRMYDLLRNKSGVSRKDVVAPAPIQLPFGDPHSIAPLPLVDLRYYSLKQNDGYQ